MTLLSTADFPYFIGCCHKPSFELLRQGSSLDFEVSLLTQPNDLQKVPAILILDQFTLTKCPLSQWQAACPETLFIVEHPVEDNSCLLVPVGLPEIFLRNAIIRAIEGLSVQNQLSCNSVN